MRVLPHNNNAGVNESREAPGTGDYMRGIASAENNRTGDFVERGGGAAARHAMSIHIRHLLNTLKG